MDIKELVTRITNLDDCIVAPPNGLPLLEEGYELPLDLKRFYELCGGVSLFVSSENAIHIVPPEEFVLANPVIVGERCEYDISSHWYIVARDENRDYLTIDLSKERLGRCYDSFWEKHGQPGDCPIIANCFTELLSRLIDNKGDRWYWLQDNFVSLGDAYDGIDLE